VSKGITSDGTVKRPPNAGNVENILKHRGTPKPHQADGRMSASGVSIEKYNEMSDAYFEEQAVDYVRKKCRVTWATARKYIELGDKTRDLPAIRDVFRDAQQLARKKRERTWAEAQLESLELIKAQKALATKALNRLARDAKAQEEFIRQAIKDPKTLAETISKIARDEAFLFEKPDSRTENNNTQVVDFRKEAAVLENDEELKEEVAKILDKIGAKLSKAEKESQ